MNTISSPILFDLNAEQAVLSSIFYSPEKILEVNEILRSKDFYSSVNSAIFSSMILIYEKNKNIDPITVFDEISKSIKTKDMKQYGFDTVSLEDCLNTVSFSSFADLAIKQYADIVKNYSIRRNRIKICKDIINYFNNLYKKSEDIIEEFYIKSLNSEFDYKSENLSHTTTL